MKQEKECKHRWVEFMAVNDFQNIITKRYCSICKITRDIPIHPVSKTKNNQTNCSKPLTESSTAGKIGCSEQGDTQAGVKAEK